MSLSTRQAAVRKLEDLKVRGAKEGDNEILWLRQEIARIDKELLNAEVERLKRSKLSFQGEGLEQRLGVDAWVLRNC